MKITLQDLDDYNQNSLYQTIGLQLIAVADGAARSHLKPEKAVCWPFPGQPHGGILFTLMDTTMAWAVLSIIETGHNCATVDLNLHFTRPAQGGLFECQTQVTHHTRRSCFLRGDIFNHEGKLVAMGQGVFRIIQMDLPSTNH